MSEFPPSTILLAATESVQHRLTSGLLESLSQWWQVPLLVLAVAAIALFVIWMYRRDAVELPPGVGAALALLRLGALGALLAAYLDFERRSEHELVFPSRVAVLVDASASMTLDDGSQTGGAAAVDATGGPVSRTRQALAVLDEGGLLAALAPRHEVAVWRFEADAEPLVLLPVSGSDPPATGAGKTDSAAAAMPGWRERIQPRGFETRIGETLARVLDQEPSGSLAAIVLLSDGANNAGVDPAIATSPLGAASIAVHVIGIGSERLPSNVRVADVIVPTRVFPGDRFAVTGYLQAQGLAGQTVTVQLLEAAENGPERVIDALDAQLAADGTLAAVRFDVPGIEAPGRRQLTLRVTAPAADTTAADNAQSVEIEVVDRVTRVLLMAGGPSREYQFMRNILERDKSFTVDVLLGTATEGVSQDARAILAAFPPTMEELSEYDAILAYDYDWRRLDPAAQSRLERWVSEESGGLVLVAGNVFMDAWLADPQSAPIRNLHPVELRRSAGLLLDSPAGFEEPMPLDFTRDGQEAEFLWLGGTRIASQTVWSEFPGVFACFDATAAKPGATIYAHLRRPGQTGSARAAADQSGLIYMAGQFYGSGNVFFLGSGETWRLRRLDDAVYERLATQLVRHVSQGRLLRGSRRARLLLDRDRYPVGSSVAVRVVSDRLRDNQAGSTGSATCRVTGPDGSTTRVPLGPDPARPDLAQGTFIVSSEGGWRIDVEVDGETVSRRIQARLPDRELERPRLDRGVLDQIATLSGGSARYVDSAAWTPEDARTLAARIPDRSRREYETGAPDGDFKRWLNAILLGLGVGLLCVEWIVRRLVKLA
jgi:hypothetical protein